MGACLVGNTTNLPQERLPQADLLKSEQRRRIQQELETSSNHQAEVPQSPSPEKEKENQHKRTILSKKSIKMPIKGQGSTKMMTSSRSTRQRLSGEQQISQDNVRHLKAVVIRKDFDVSLKQITEKVVQKDSPIHECTLSSQGKESEPSDKVIQEEVPEQTPYNRSENNEDWLIGKGVSEVDNRLLAQAEAAIQPINLPEIHILKKGSYEGQWLRGMRHGKGVHKWEDGSIYRGNWVNNKSCGEGKLDYADGDIYQGQWQDNQPHGQGTRLFHNGLKYTGEWAYGKQCGRGIESWADGQQYEGEWIDGRKNGYGELTFSDGSYYRGQFVGNELHGKGIYCWKDSRIYEGEWEHNRMNGFGVIRWQNGDSYEGSIRNDKMHGEGVYRTKEGCISTGQWQHNRKNGMFTQIDGQGRSKTVQWYMGKKIKPFGMTQSKQREAKHSIDSKTTSSRP